MKINVTILVVTIENVLKKGRNGGLLGGYVNGEENPAAFLCCAYMLYRILYICNPYGE